MPLRVYLWTSNLIFVWVFQLKYYQILYNSNLHCEGWRSNMNLGLLCHSFVLFFSFGIEVWGSCPFFSILDSLQKKEDKNSILKGVWESRDEGHNCHSLDYKEKKLGDDYFVLIVFWQHFTDHLHCPIILVSLHKHKNGAHTYRCKSFYRM